MVYPTGMDATGHGSVRSLVLILLALAAAGGLGLLAARWSRQADLPDARLPVRKDVPDAAAVDAGSPPAGQSPASGPARAASQPGFPRYRWISRYDPVHSLAARIAPPPGFARRDELSPTFAAWLRGLPLKPGKPEVKLFDGRPKPRQDVHHAVIDIDAGRRDLQQCADAVIRLRAEYRFSMTDSGTTVPIAFNFTSGDRAFWHVWAQGQRPRVKGSTVTWVQSARADWSHGNFRQYLDCVFTYAGTASLARELKPVRSAADIEAGDVFIRGGSPGHAVLVVDTACEAAGRKVFLLAQSYMPAQDIHVLVNPGDARLSPWYSCDFGSKLVTPEWTFDAAELKRF